MRDHVWTRHDDGSITCRRCHVTLQSAAGVPCKPANKYHAERVQLDGYTFDSKLEATYYVGLTMRQLVGEISDLRVHPRFPLHVGRVRIGEYEADFSYRVPDGSMVVADVKGVETAIFRWKRRHFEAEYGIPIEIIKDGR